jgi:hypothetical protein
MESAATEATAEAATSTESATTMEATATPEAATAVESAATAVRPAAASPASTALSGQRQCQQATNENAPRDFSHNTVPNRSLPPWAADGKGGYGTTGKINADACCAS